MKTMPGQPMPVLPEPEAIMAEFAISKASRIPTQAAAVFGGVRKGRKSTPPKAGTADHPTVLLLEIHLEAVRKQVHLLLAGVVAQAVVAVIPAVHLQQADRAVAAGDNLLKANPKDEKADAYFFTAGVTVSCTNWLPE